MTNEQNNSLSALFESLLKTPLHLIEDIRANPSPGQLIGKLLLITALGFLIFGVTLGSFSFQEQLWAAPLKTLLGLAFSSLICFPSLYIFTALTGTKLKLIEIAQGMAGALALISCLLLGFTPVLWVFSQSTDSAAFFGALVLAIWLIALLFGTGFLLKMLKQSGRTKAAPLRIWIGIFLLVTLQMSTTLRPIIGTSEHYFTSDKLFFIEHWKNSFESKTTQKLPAPNNERRIPQSETPPASQNTKSNPFLNE